VYASAGIGEYWIVNLGARTVEVYASPDGDRYAEVRTLRAGDALRPAALPDVALTVAEISTDWCPRGRHVDHQP